MFAITACGTWTASWRERAGFAVSEGDSPFPTR
jgi:hypothetical protein